MVNFAHVSVLILYYCDLVFEIEAMRTLQDNPVGTGYSSVEHQSALVKTDEDAATDLTTLLKSLYNSNAKL